MATVSHLLFVVMNVDMLFETPLHSFVALHYERHPESVRGCLGLSCGP